MIPLRLLDGLKERIETIFANYQYKRPASADEEEDPYSSVNVYTQRLPVKENRDDTPFPFVLVKLIQGNQADLVESDHLVNVSIIVGMYNRDNDNQGDRDVSLAIDKIVESLLKDPIIDGVFNLDTESELNWSISEEETEPFFFGGLACTYVAPKFQREDLNKYL